MDYYGTDRKLSELGEQDLEDFLDQDMFTPPSNDSTLDTFALVDNNSGDDVPMDNEWLDNFFDDPVLNDRMMSDALQPRRAVQSEHSYSLANEEKVALAGQQVIKVEVTEKPQNMDLDLDLLGSAINPNMTLSSGASASVVNTTYIDTTSGSVPQVCIKQEPIYAQDEVTMATNSITTAPTPVAMTTRVSQVHPHTLLKQPTIILATTTTQHSPRPLEGDTVMPSLTSAVRSERVVLPKVNIKMEPYDTSSNMSSPEHTTMYDSIGLPPTPPSSSNSDSEGSNSPQRSAPPSPIRHSQSRSHTHHSLGGVSEAFSQPIFTSPTFDHRSYLLDQIPTSGVLMLSEEEKRTLVTEGYPIPNKLPLTKQEEKNLKKIRRKIKNKISAQESRRKKKEYLETLEKKVEAFNCENSDLKRKVDNLETNNRSLLGQLQKLQSMVAKMPRPPTPSSSQTGTCLMVLVLFFAVFMGTWSPMTWSVGYSMSGPAASLSVAQLPRSSGPQIGPEIQEAVSDAYSSYGMPRSRVLLSIKDELDDSAGPDMAFSYNSFFTRWFTKEGSCSTQASEDFAVSAPNAQVPAGGAQQHDDEGSYNTVDIVTDLALNYTTKVMTAPVNTTA